MKIEFKGLFLWENFLLLFGVWVSYIRELTEFAIVEWPE